MFAHPVECDTLQTWRWHLVSLRCTWFMRLFVFIPKGLMPLICDQPFILILLFSEEISESISCLEDDFEEID